MTKKSKNRTTFNYMSTLLLHNSIAHLPSNELTKANTQMKALTELEALTELDGITYLRVIYKT